MGGSWEVRKRWLRMVKNTILQYGDHWPTLILRLLFGVCNIERKGLPPASDHWGPWGPRKLGKNMAIWPKKSPRVPQCYPFPLWNLQNVPQIIETRGFNGVVQSWQLKSNRRPEYPSMWFGPLILNLVNPGVLGCAFWHCLFGCWFKVWCYYILGERIEIQCLALFYMVLNQKVDGFCNRTCYFLTLSDHFVIREKRSMLGHILCGV